ncbi:phosphotransferase [Bacillus sp. JJ722]|uniref:phosphotransferase n=1 Tax=Bacillus sp. JJ722 TaxID=3122973 RepID=UPI002FFF3C51
MVLKEKDVIDVAYHFNIEHIEQIQFYRNEDNILVEFYSHGQQFYLKGEEANEEFTQKTVQFASLMKEKGFPFTTYLYTDSGAPTFKYNNFILTLEEKIEGTEIEQLTMLQLKEIGSLLGKQHQLSSQINFSFDSGTSFGMFGGNATDSLGDYDENELSFQDFINAMIGKDLVDDIQKIYLEKRQHVKEVWHSLPSGPVQGDFCPYNMIFSETGKIKGVYDFNIAGNEVFLNECIAAGVYISWHYSFAGEESPLERFHCFMQSYENSRPLTLLERTYFDTIFQIIRAFRFDRIEEGIEDKVRHKKFIEETYEILNSSSGYIPCK